MFKKLAKEKNAPNYKFDQGKNIVWEKEPDEEDDKVVEDELTEELADLEHKQWIHWMEYLIDNITDENIEKWKKEIKTPYKELSEKGKDSDREWARKAIGIMQQHSEEVDISSVTKQLKDLKLQLEDMEKERKQDNEDLINILQTHKVL